MEEYGEKESWAVLFRLDKTFSQLIQPLPFSYDGGQVLFMDVHRKLSQFDMKEEAEYDEVCGFPCNNHLGIDISVGSLVLLGEHNKGKEG